MSLQAGHDAHCQSSRYYQVWRYIRTLCMLTGDLVLLNTAVIIALAARFDGHIPVHYWQSYIALAPWYSVFSMTVFAWRGLYGSLWRYAGIEEMLNVSAASLLSTMSLSMLALWYPLPRLVFPIHGFILIVLVTWSRLVLRSIRRLIILRSQNGTWSRVVKGARSNVLIVGVARASVDLVAPLRQSGRRVVGFVDDDPAKLGSLVHGVRVLAGTDAVTELVQRHDVQEVLLALPGEQRQKQRRIVESLSGRNVTLRIIPTMDELIDGKVTVSQIRPVSIEDLLGREPVRLNVEQIASDIRGQVVLVTGAGGSIGSELCRQLCRFQPELLIMLGHGENSIFEAALDINARFPQVRKEYVIADVRDRNRIQRVFSDFRPNYVFHAAAHKHVPYMEDYPEEAVKTNVFGTQNVARASLEYGARKFVMVSTDKAVNPTSVMGASKRVAEMVIQSLNDGVGTRFVSVRFGNVLGSRGSVVPVFQRQIAQGGPVTVTDPEMKRYFMTIPEASQLVLQAAALGQGGEVFVLDMGEPVKIVDLARNLITLSGFRPDKDIKIVFTGRRPGEKLFEELLMDEEGTTMTTHSRIFVSRNAIPPQDELEAKLAVLEQATFAGESESIQDILRDMIPGYRPYMPVEASAVSS
jgi:FlaA1/EpsC-like NDP-sugar epimerase